MTTHSDDLGTADLAGDDRRHLDREDERHHDDPVVLDSTDEDRPEHEPLKGFDPAAPTLAGTGAGTDMGTATGLDTGMRKGTGTGLGDEPADGDLLFAPGDSADFERRWGDVQTAFVDDPRSAVESADHLVAEVMQSLARRFADHKESLEEQWSGGGEADTEELRQALQRYRTFFHRLLAA